MNIEEAQKIADQNAHIPTGEVQQDIADTETEIATMEREIKGLRLIGDRLSHFRADAREAGIKDRKEFIKKLKKILEIRGVKD